LNCESCVSRYASSQQKPLCRTKRGCPIKDLAQDVEITRKVKAYARARALMQYEHLRPLGIKELESNQLTNPSLLIDLEKRVAKYIESSKQREQNEIALKEKGKSGKLGGLT
jgi:hypothetical protein